MKPLIRKSWYTLTEAADYLTQSTEGGPVTVTDVLQLALDGDLTISILITEESEAEFRFAQVKPRHELTEEEKRELEDRDNWPENPLEWGLDFEGEIYESTRLTTHWLFRDVYDIVWFPSGEELFFKLWTESKKQIVTDPDAFNPTIVKTARRFGLEIKLFDAARRLVYSVPTHAIPKNSYLVVKRAKLEQLLSDDTSTAASDQSESETEATELRRTQRTLAALATGLAEKYPSYRHGEKPNVSQLAALAAEPFLDENAKSPTGWTSATFKKAIEAALASTNLPEE